MINLSPERIAATMDARLVAAGTGGRPVAAGIDSRSVQPGELFFGLAGAETDGGRFAADALAAGAWGVVVTPQYAERPAGADGYVFAAADPLAALQGLARAWRRELGATVIGVTGSVGKTSVKDMIRSLLPGETHASDENFNTEIGLPLSVLAAPENTVNLVLEMAMRGSGQIAELARIAEPDVGVINNVGPVHTELLGSVEAVAAAKAELAYGLPEGGTLVAPVDAGPLEPHLEGIQRLLRFGPGGDVELAGVEPAPEGEPGLLAVATVKTPDGRHHFPLPFDEPHNLVNLLAAVAAGIAAGFKPREMAARSAGITLSRLRGERIRLGREGTAGGLLLNDCYNANPVSMRAAVEYLASRPGYGYRVAVLGEMAELGENRDAYHREIGDLARRLGIDLVIGVGDVARAYRPDELVDSPAAAAAAVNRHLGPDTILLVKGSRSAGLETVAELLVAEHGGEA